MPTATLDRRQASPRPVTARTQQLRDQDACERLIDAKLQDTEVLSLRHRLEERRLAAVRAIHEGRPEVALAHLTAQGLLLEELEVVEQKDVKRHDGDADRLRIVQFGAPSYQPAPGRMAAFELAVQACEAITRAWGRENSLAHHAGELVGRLQFKLNLEAREVAR